MEKRVALFEVKALDDATDPNGEFEAILSVPTVDRDGEVIDAGAFNPLPADLAIHKYHDFSEPVASAVPRYDGDVLKARGVFDPDPDSQQFRTKVGKSVRYMSVGFMAATRSDEDGVTHITKAELLEASFVSVPSNREAAILAVKSAAAKVGARNSATDAERLQMIHDFSTANGAKCADPDPKSPAIKPEEKSATAPAPAGAVPDVPSSVEVARARAAALRAQAAMLLIA